MMDSVYSLGMIDILFEHFFGWQIYVNLYVQQWFAPAAPLFAVLSEYFSPGKLWDVAVPFVGLFSDSLLRALVYMLSLVNVITSGIKWFIPANRPHWWLREHGSTYNETIELEQFDLSCETSAGFPSHHVVAFNVFVLLVVTYALKSVFDAFHIKKSFWTPVYSLIAMVTVLLMWLSRLYYATTFLHQCFLSSALVSLLLAYFQKYKKKLMWVSRPKALASILVLVTCFYIDYMIKIYFDIDPHWSVRMAFKWCPDPTFLRHESAPFYVLARDVGYLVGVALSAPLINARKTNCSLYKRFAIMMTIEVINYNMRSYTPKESGRIAFLGFEFARSVIHSYILLNTFSWESSMRQSKPKCT